MSSLVSPPCTTCIVACLPHIQPASWNVPCSGYSGCTSARHVALLAGLELEGVYGARVAPQLGAVALHVFGTRQGTCPPGSVLADGTRNGTGGSGGFWQGGGSDTAAPYDTLSAGGPFGLTFNGSVIDLSSAFQSE